MTDIQYRPTQDTNPDNDLYGGLNNIYDTYGEEEESEDSFPTHNFFAVKFL